MSDLSLSLADARSPQSLLKKVDSVLPLKSVRFDTQSIDTLEVAIVGKD